ncbi:hypothetical protein [Phenylobacterium sp. SCN 70-31]|uniref:hypothetical protein n=1 Tax=Phenylobacterium sp. SCN 70-31 TaxID=1660129 RepID=UPI0025F3BA18|nr:hypothetical protein [Phenylobacterium sp. SCN 70-31]
MSSNTHRDGCDPAGAFAPVPPPAEPLRLVPLVYKVVAATGFLAGVLIVLAKAGAL